MKKNFMQAILLPGLILLAAGCRKESVSIIEDKNPVSVLRTSSPGGCNVTSYDFYNAVDDYHSVDHYSYEDGRVNEVQTYMRYIMEYNKQGKLIRSRVYDDTRPVYIITFEYRDNKVVKETWRYAYNNEIYDQVILTYNKKGDLARNESIVQNYFTVYTYSPNGSLMSWTFYAAGTPLQKGEYTYDDQYKNPLSTLTGLDHMFMYANSGFGVGMGKKWFSSEKISYWDGSSWFTYYDFDPAKTIWNKGKQNYPVHAVYSENRSGTSFTHTFTYENCNGHAENISAAGQLQTIMAEGSVNIKEGPLPKKLIY